MKVFFLLIFLWSSWSLVLGQDFHTLELWHELEPVVLDMEPYPIPREAIIKDLLETARFYFTGMIYGYQFRYTPSDNQRRVTESFQMEALAEIPFGDPRLEVNSTWVHKDRLYVRFLYHLDDYQQQRAMAWESNTIPQTQALGSGNYFLGAEEIRTSMKEAVKEGIRTYLRKKIYNKPKLIQGEVLFRNSPYTVISQGEYKTRVRCKLRLAQITPYSRF